MRPQALRSFARHGRLLLLHVVVLIFGVGLSAAERDAVKVLTIGNSFAQDATFYLPQLALAGGKKLILGKANIGGCSLERHARHLREAEAGDPAGQAYENTTDPQTGRKRDMSLPQLLRAETWDIVTIQQSSLLSFRLETFQPSADELIAAIRKYAPAAEIVIHETWAYREDHPLFQQADGFTPRRMHEGLRAAYTTLAAASGLRLIPVGDAFAIARRSVRWTYLPDRSFDFAHPPASQLPDQCGSLNIGWRWAADETGVPKLSLDATHCNVAGRYLGAAVWYQVIFNTDSIPVGFIPDGLTVADTSDLRLHARGAVAAQLKP